MDKKTPEDQWICLDAVNNPGAYVPPLDSGASTMTERIGTLKALGAVPMKRGALTEIQAAYALPGELLSSLGDVSSFARGMKTLDRWRSMGLLIPVAAADSPRYGNMSADEYERAAKILCFGHTSALLEKLRFLEGELRGMSLPLNYVSTMYFRAVEQVEKMKEREITPLDTRFILETAELFERRGRIIRRRIALYPGGALAGGAAAWLLTRLIGPWALLLFIVIHFGCLGLFAGSQERWYNDHRVASGMTFIFFAIMLIIRDSARAGAYRLSLLLPPTGAAMGFMVAYMLQRRALSKNTRAVMDECFAFYTSKPDPETGGVVGER
jgi:hypothetical protein